MALSDGCVGPRSVSRCFDALRYFWVYALAMPWAMYNLPASAQSASTIGIVVSSKQLAVHETPFMDECPAGLAVGNDEYWWRSLDPQTREKLTLGGTREVAASVRQDMAMTRGPNGEQVCHFPKVVKDPPMRLVEGTISFGLNLDGIDGAGTTGQSCAHEDFTSPDGEPGIDNQLYRLFGCAAAWRSFGFITTASDDDRKSSGLGMILIEITNVDDRLNDDDVDVQIFRAIDPHRLDSTGKVLPFSTYRIDMDGDKPRYNSRAKGRIVDGELITEPVEAYLPAYAIVTFQRQRLRDMRMQLELPDAGGRGHGLLAGYVDVSQVWDYVRGLGGLSATGQFSCPAIYDALYHLADAYPDPETGQCTGISAAYQIEVTSAFIEKPDELTSVGAASVMKADLRDDF